MLTDVAVRSGATWGASPTWDPVSSTLVWVDVPACGVHRHSPASGDDAVLVIPQPVGAAKPRTRGGLVLNLRDGVALIDPNETKTWLVYWARDGVSAGGAEVDPTGRIWAGTTRYGGEAADGWLARVDANGDAAVVRKDLGPGGGLAWSPDGQLLYHCADGRIDVMAFDRATGGVSGLRTLVEVERGLPDGVCVDADGCLWVALREGGAVRRYTPDGVLDRELELPVERPTGCCFGGPDLTDLYVTSAREGAHGGGELAGSVLVVPDAGTGLMSRAFAG
ncbi:MULTISPECIES: SMP-30/gluconolactonase/LRE family protein [Actinosynnema]|uniref:Calcium-binding protein n=1 Tax=Actinosynnema pretiosum TaxID=42197 RepID=A0A290Z1A6_9PSEU|nr:SMP-30/gluconolactonase/LRE family protein [Actinosynnema pretiosum]ATE52739.1 calcium-binding protein [Actinosynnema pretiosum]